MAGDGRLLSGHAPKPSRLRGTEPSRARATGATVGPALARASLLLGAPLLVAYAWTSCRGYDCALSAPLIAIAHGGSSAIADLLAAGPRPTLAGFGLFTAWYVVQAVLAMLLPGGR